MITIPMTPAWTPPLFFPPPPPPELWLWALTNFPVTCMFCREREVLRSKRREGELQGSGGRKREKETEQRKDIFNDNAMQYVPLALSSQECWPICSYWLWRTYINTILCTGTVNNHFHVGVSISEHDFSWPVAEGQDKHAQQWVSTKQSHTATLSCAQVTGPVRGPPLLFFLLSIRLAPEPMFCNDSSWS